MLLWTMWIAQALAAGGGHGEADSHGGALIPPWDQLGMAAVAVVLFLGIMIRFAGRPISDFLKGRAFAVQHSLDAAAKLRTDAQARFDEIEARIAGMDAKISAMKAESEVQANLEASVLEQKANADAARIRAAAERTIRDEVGRARHALQAELASAAAELAAAQIRATLTDEDRRRLDAELLVTLNSREAR